MNIILLENNELCNDCAVLSDRRAEHVVKVLRSDRGDRLTVGIINGKIGYGIIKEISRKKPYHVALHVTLEQPPNPPEPIDIMLALPRPVVFKRVIGQLTALGVNHVYIVNAAKVEKSYWESSVILDNGWKQYMLAGLEQAVDTRLVEFSFHRGFKPFVLNTLPEICSNYEQMLVAHPGSGKRLHEVFRAGNKRVLVAIGPEGGWNDYEIGELLKKGFTEFSIGPRILRVESAVTAVHASVSLMQHAASTGKNLWLP